MRIWFAVLSACLVLLAPAATLAGDRHALVIGIDRYDHVTPLQKARNDAQAVSAALEPLGFRVSTLLDPARRDINEALSAFAAGLSPGDEALFYFAGHGIEVSGRNYLLPADVPAAGPGDEDFVIGEAIGVDRILATLQRRGVRVSLLILDACRDNPFPTEGTRSLGASRGLARVEAPEGAFILFSAGTGQAALDRLSDTDPDPNSVFTRALLPRLQQPGLDIHTLTQEVRRDVRALARTVNHDQFPAYYDQLTGTFALNPGPPPAALPEPTVTVPAADPCAGAVQVWSALSESDSLDALRSFATTYADGCPPLAELARTRAEALAAALAEQQAPQPDPQPDPPDTQVAALPETPPETPPEAAPETAPETPPAAAPRAMESGIADFLRRHLRAWSDDRDTALAQMRRDYAETVDFFGTRMPHARVLQDKRNFAARWPVRDYRMEDGSLTVDCDAAGRRCELAYTILWDARSPARGARSRGRSSVEMTVERRDSGFVILRETGRTLERF